MPVISRFYGITIRMYFLQSEHNPPHIHAMYGEDAAAIGLINSEMLDGYLPNRVVGMVNEWIDLHRDELIHIWETQEFTAIEPLE